MSESTPSDSSGGPASGRPARRNGESALWMVLSAVLHAALFGSLVLFTPLRDIVIRPQTPEDERSVVSAEKLEQLAEQLRDINEVEMIERVAELHAIQDAMDAIEEEKAQEYDAFRVEQAADAPQRALEEQLRAMEAQRRAIEQQKQIEAAEERTDEAHDRVVREQSTAAQAQSDAGDRLTMAAEGGWDVAEARQSQRRAQDEQARASDAERAAREAQERVSQARRAENSASGAAKRSQESHRRAEAAVAKAKADVEKYEQNLKETRDKLAEAQAAAQENKRAAGKVAQLERQAKSQEDALGRARQSLETRAADEKAKSAAAGKAVEEAEGAAKRVAAAAATAAKELQAAAEAQEKALRAQREAHDTLAKAIAGAKPSSGEAVKPKSAVAGRSSMAERPDTRQMDVADLYREAVETEKEIAQSYGKIRTTDLAMIRDMSLERADKLTDKPTPSRPKIDEDALRGKVETGKAFERQKEVVAQAVGETRSMVALGESLLAQAQAGRRNVADGLAMEEIRAAAAHAAAVDRASHEEAGGKIGDMTGLMKGNGSAGAAKAGGAPGGPAGGKQKPGEDDKRFAAAADPWAKYRPPPQAKKIVGAKPARKVLPGAARTDWIFVDTWYTIGPFPNPGRANIHRQFPPESVVDLGASYADGKGGRTLRWKFVQSDKPDVVPADDEEYGIWYAYTELKFDRPRDVWIAVGSDDRSDLWINDIRVWSSSDVLKSWQINEGLRRVHFQQGRNRVLMRIENGWHSTQFSLCIFVGEPAE